MKICDRCLKKEARYDLSINPRYEKCDKKDLCEDCLVELSNWFNNYYSGQKDKKEKKNEI
jgi:hypothetical protein